MQFPPFSWWARQSAESTRRGDEADVALDAAQRGLVDRINYLDARAEHYARFGFHAEDGSALSARPSGDARDGGPPSVGA